MCRSLCIPLMLAACALPHAPYNPKIGGSDAENKAASIAAFNEHVRPVLQHCATCHTETQAPFFMADDVNAAHTAATPLVNFNDVDQSRLLERIIDDEHNCGGDCQTLGNKLRTALNKWKGVRAKNSSGGKGAETPAKVMNNAQEHDISWDIGGLIGSQYRGKVDIAVDVQPDTDNNVYILTNLRVRAEEIDVYIGAVTPILNGEPSESTTYSKLDCKVTAATSKSNFTVVATGTNLTPTDFTANNKLSLAFEDLRLAEDSDKKCFDDDDETSSLDFNSDIKPILDTTCGGCHANPPRQDVTTLPILTANKDRVLRFLGGDTTDGHNRQNRIQAMSDADKQKVIDFLNTE